MLFIDETYRLVAEHEGHSFGKDAINTLLKYMEDLRAGSSSSSSDTPRRCSGS